MFKNPSQSSQKVKLLHKAVFLTKEQREQLKSKQQEQTINDQQKSQLIQIQKEQFDKSKRKYSRSRSKSPKKIEQNQNKIEPDSNYQTHEINSIKQQYLSLNTQKKKATLPSEKFRQVFKFQWSDDEDTSKDVNPLYQGKLKSQNNDFMDSSHWSQKQTKNFTERDWRIFKEDNQIFIKGARCPNPFRFWEQLPQHIQNAIKALQFKTPTSIQMQAIPIGLEKMDLIGIAPTGSGKSLAFLTPLFSYVYEKPLLDSYTCTHGPYALILTPTRELAQQLLKELQKITKNTEIRSEMVVGGRKQEDQAFLIRVGVEILIGTPGRIKDMLEGKDIVLNQCGWIVLDEADKMVDLGFEEDVNYIFDKIGVQNRVTQLFSATMPIAVERMAKKLLSNYCFLTIGDPGSAKKEIDQKVEIMTEDNKKQYFQFRRKLHKLLDHAKPPIIVFANTQVSVESVAKSIEAWGFYCITYHGGKTQEKRELAIEQFKKKKYDILVTTDLGGRGLDVEGVTLVVNYDAPFNIQDFIHRTGRTARAGKSGTAYTFLTGKDEELFHDLKEFLVKNGYEVPQDLDQHPASRIKPGKKAEYQPRSKQVVYAQ